MNTTETEIICWIWYPVEQWMIWPFSLSAEEVAAAAKKEQLAKVLNKKKSWSYSWARYLSCIDSCGRHTSSCQVTLHASNWNFWMCVYENLEILICFKFFFFAYSLPVTIQCAESIVCDVKKNLINWNLVRDYWSCVGEAYLLKTFTMECEVFPP